MMISGAEKAIGVEVGTLTVTTTGTLRAHTAVIARVVTKTNGSAEVGNSGLSAAL